MSEVYIRSQKKDGLYILGESQSIRYGTSNERIFFYMGGDDERETGKHYVMLLKNNGERETLGEYESRERCLEVMDEIQAVCGQYLYAPGNSGLMSGSTATPPMAAMIPRLYVMPEK